MLVSPAEDKAVSSVDTLSVWRMFVPACMLSAVSNNLLGHAHHVSPFVKEGQGGIGLGRHDEIPPHPFHKGGVKPKVSLKKAITCGGRHGVDIPH